MLALSVIKDELREGKYAWPGGYPKFFTACDGEALSFEAVRENFREVVRAHLQRDENSDWLLCGYDVNWEDPELYCAHTNQRIESAYAEPEAPTDGH
jgi:hypothetical protein